MRSGPRIGVVGATGAVGAVTLALLAERGYEQVRAFASSRSAGQRVQFATTTPAGGPGEFVNALNPRIALFDPAGNQVATGTPDRSAG